MLPFPSFRLEVLRPTYPVLIAPLRRGNGTGTGVPAGPSCGIPVPVRAPEPELVGVDTGRPGFEDLRVLSGNRGFTHQRRRVRSLGCGSRISQGSSRVCSLGYAFFFSVNGRERRGVDPDPGLQARAG